MKQMRRRQAPAASPALLRALTSGDSRLNTPETTPPSIPTNPATGPDGRVILRCVVHEDSRNDKRQRRGGAHHRGDAGGRLALPVRADHHIEAGFSTVLLADLG